MSIIESQEPAYREEHEIDVLTKRIAELERELAAARNANPCVDAMAGAMEDAKSMQQLVWTMEREAREASERIGQLESKLKHMSDYNAKLKAEHDRCFHDANAAATSRMGQVDNLNRYIEQLESLVRDLAPFVCADDGIEGIEQRMAALGLLGGDAE